MNEERKKDDGWIVPIAIFLGAALTIVATTIVGIRKFLLGLYNSIPEEERALEEAEAENERLNALS